jgi:hypothetical protein
MLIAILAVTFLGGGSGTAPILNQLNEVQAYVEESVVVDTRRTEALRIIGSMKASAEAFATTRKAHTAVLMDRVSSHETSGNALDAQILEADAAVREFQAELLDELEALKGVLGREHWEAMNVWNQ